MKLFSFATQSENNFIFKRKFSKLPIIEKRLNSVFHTDKGDGNACLIFNIQ